MARSRPTIRRLYVLFVALAAISGCLAARAASVEVHPYLPLNDAEPGRGTEFAFYVVSGSPFRQSLPVTAADLPAGWSFEPEAPTLDLAGGKSTSLVVRVTPDRNATYGPHAIGVLVGGARADVVVNVADLGAEPLRAGIGAQVAYVLWYDNGTLIESNDHAAHDQPGLAWVADGSPPDDAPLKVYVGGQRGTPPPEPYNSTGCDDPPCYHPVIPGFDARLRNAGDGSGMVAGETLAVRVPKEQAYTYPGNEQHPLYGENLNFLIRIVSVDVLHPKSCSLPVCAPT
jgi:hypothetical protein